MGLLIPLPSGLLFLYLEKYCATIKNNEKTKAIFIIFFFFYFSIIVKSILAEIIFVFVKPNLRFNPSALILP